MSIQAPVFDKADPKVASAAVPFALPRSEEWAEQTDFFGNSAMMMAGSGMFMKNPLIVWISAVISVASFVTAEPLRRKADASSPLAGLGMAAAGILGTTLPKMMLAPETAAQVKV
ncbi:hypothetical protein Q5752_003448 [Cryptotrichosporon argae]